MVETGCINPYGEGVGAVKQTDEVGVVYKCKGFAVGSYFGLTHG